MASCELHTRHSSRVVPPPILADGTKTVIIEAFQSKQLQFQKAGEGKGLNTPCWQRVCVQYLSSFDAAFQSTLAQAKALLTALPAPQSEPMNAVSADVSPSR